MIHRIVKLTLHPELLEDFYQLFIQVKPIILNQGGCRSVELLTDSKKNGIVFTYSIWESESDLEKYRQSIFFQQTWDKTKKLFNGKPEAWSCFSPGSGIDKIK